MNAIEVLENGHQIVIQTVEDLPESEWEVPGVCGEWSVKDTVAHLTSHELALIDVLNTFKGEQPSPYVQRLLTDGENFNTEAVKTRQYHTAQQVLTEYQDAQVRSTSLLEQIPNEKIEAKGTLPWYKAELSLADVINSFYGHTREHCAQIAQFHGKTDAS